MRNAKFELNVKLIRMTDWLILQHPGENVEARSGSGSLLVRMSQIKLGFGKFILEPYEKH